MQINFAASFIAFLVLLFVLPTYSEESSKSAQTSEQQNAEPQVRNEFAEGMQWLNVERPLDLADMKGKVVILDFWTYGCINCVHVLADLKKLEEKYGHQLLVIGVHTPKFDNEKNIETVRNIVIRYEIEHPVVHDVEYTLARKYGMRAWPTRVVIDPNGKALGKLTGEGHYELFDDIIAKLLEEHAAIINHDPVPLKLERERLALSVLAAPGKLAVSDKNIAISDTLHHRVLITDYQGKIQKVFGGKEKGFKDGNKNKALFNAPQGLVFFGQGLFVADTGNHRIRYIDLANDRVKTYVGNGQLQRVRYGEFDAEHVGLASPWALALKENKLYIAMAGSHQIWVYDTQTDKVGTFAGSGDEGINDGKLYEATFSQPSGLSIQGDWLYVADAEDSAIRRIHLKKEIVETVVGTGLFDFGDRDGPFHKARLQHVLGVAASGEHQLYIADTYNHKLKLLDLSEKKVTSIVGNGKPGSDLIDKRGIQLNEPGGLAEFAQGILVADTNNHRIVIYDPNSKRAKVFPVYFSDEPR